MKKYYLQNGEEIQLGDTITMCTEKKIGSVTLKVKGEILLTESTLEVLIRDGLITPGTESTSSNYKYYLEKIGEKLGINLEEVKILLKALLKDWPMAVWNILLREIALECDLQYPNHIKDSSELFGVNSLDLNIFTINRCNIGSFKHFAAFRSREDATMAIGVVKDFLEDIRNEEGKQKD